MTTTSPIKLAEAPRPTERLLPVAAAILTVALWASAFVGIRSADRELAPGALALLRLLVGAVALSLLMLARGEKLPPRRTLPGIVACGVLWFGAYNILLNEAETRVDAGTASMLVNVGPVLIALIAGVALREGFPPRLLAGCAVALVGAAVIGIATSGHGVSLSLGAVLCVAAAFVYACGIVAQKPTLRSASALQVTWLGCVVGAVVCLPFGPALGRDLGHASGSSIAWAVYLGIFPTAIGFVAWAYALGRTTAGKLGSLTYLVPPLAIFFGWILLDEAPPALAYAGGALCLLGVAITRYAPGTATRLRRPMSFRPRAGRTP